MKTRLIRLVFVVGSLIAANIAHAGAFIGAGVSNYSYDYSDLDNSTGSKIFAGYYAENGIFGEVALVDLGDTEAEGTTLGLAVEGVVAYLGYRTEDGTGLGAYGKVGFYSFDSDLLVSGNSVLTESSSGLAWALGLSLALNKTFAIRGEIEQFVGVEDFADDNSITGFSLSLEARF